MATCEMCGANENSLVSVQIAGSVMNVCRNCKSMGTQVETKNENLSHTFKRSKKDSSIEEVALNYNELIQSGMNKKGLNTHQLARAVNVKESSLTNYLKGSIKPDVQTAKKLANFLEIDLVFTVDENSKLDYDDFTQDNNSQSSQTLGDLISKQLNNK